MRIAIFSLAYLPFVGGAEIAVKEITDRLPSRDFFCFTRRFGNSWPEKEKMGNVGVWRLGGSNFNTTDRAHKSYWGKFVYIFRAWRVAERLHKEKPFEVIWSIMAAYAGLAALLFKLRHPSVPFLLTLQEGDSEKHILKRVGFFYPFWRLIFKKADYIQAISNHLADFGRRHGARCPIEVVSNGVDVDKFQILNPKSQINSNNQNLKFKTIITTSRLVYKNGIDILIRAVAVIASPDGNSMSSDGINSAKQSQEHHDIKLQILGSGSDEEKLKKLAKDLKVEEKIQFLGHIEPEKISEYLKEADIFVRMSRSEGLGNSFLEAMAAGLPVIGTNVGGIPDFLQDGKTGLFANIDDPADCAQKIKQLMENLDLRRRLSENGRKLVEEKYNWNQIADKMGYIFDKLRSNS